MTSERDDRPLVILAPAPQRIERIFSPAVLAALHARYRVVDLEADPSSGHA